MKKLLAVLPVLLLATACVPAAYPRQRMPFGYPGGPEMYGPSVRYRVAALPIGRWDNVMLLAAGTPVQVLTLSGGMASGDTVSADSARLRVRTASGEVEFAAGDVMRVDRLAGSSSMVKDAAKGAAFGAGAVGVLGLLVGHVPPARVFAAGAIAGGYENAQLGSLGREAMTIYLSPAVAPGAAVGPQWTPAAARRW